MTDGPGDYPHPTITLNDAEAYGVALRLAARQVASDWLEWEDVGWLGEDSFERVEKAMEQVAVNMRTLSRGYDAAHDIDSADILSRAEA